MSLRLQRWLAQEFVQNHGPRVVKKSTAGCVRRSKTSLLKLMRSILLKSKSVWITQMNSFQLSLFYVAYRQYSIVNIMGGHISCPKTWLCSTRVKLKYWPIYWGYSGLVIQIKRALKTVIVAVVRSCCQFFSQTRYLNIVFYWQNQNFQQPRLKTHIFAYL